MSIWQFIKRWQAGLQQKKKNKKYSYTTDDLVHLHLTETTVQETRNQKEQTSDSLLDKMQNDLNNVDERYHLWMSLL
jgi:hypothetical protein